MPAMRVEFVNPFIDAATSVLQAEVQQTINRGNMSLHNSATTTLDVSAIVAVTGKIHGIVMYGMSTDTAKAMVSIMLGQDFEELNDLAISGIAELGNVITGTASIFLEKAGFPSKLAPPVVIVGSGSKISTLDIQRLVVPLTAEVGVIEVQVAIKEAPVTPQN